MALLLSIHVLANLVWVGSLTAIGLMLSWAAKEPDAARGKVQAETALLLYRRVANPAFMVSFLFGVARLAMNAGYYMKAHWFHGKLTMALVVIGLHHVLGAKAKRAASTSMQAGTSGAILVGAVIGSAFAAVVFVVFKTELVP
jgi:protoporphyrinogen IX oxidase